MSGSIIKRKTILSAVSAAFLLSVSGQPASSQAASPLGLESVVSLRPEAVNFDSPDPANLIRFLSIRKPLSEIRLGLPRTQMESAAPEQQYESLLLAPLWKAAHPSSADVDLRSGFSAAKAQGRRNMCNVFAATSLAEFLVNQQENSKSDFSEEFLFYDAKYNYTDRPELRVYKTGGGLGGYVAVLALQGGVVSERDWPFNPSWENPSPAPPVTDSDVGVPPADISNKILGYRFSPLAIRRSEIRDFIISERKPVAINLMVYFGNIDTATGRISQPTDAQRLACLSSGRDCGGHVVLLVGYDQARNEFIFRNSWGPKWGDGGYGRVAEKYVLQDCEVCNHMANMGRLDDDDRALVENGVYGWSAVLR
jgi:C1A family cysteine protease